MRNYTRKTERKPKRAKHGGSLELRGKVYIARWMVNGKRFAQSTGESERSKAENWLAVKLASIRAADIRATSKKMAETIQAQKAAQLDGALVQAERSAEAEIDRLPTVPLAALEAELRAAVEGKVRAATVSAYTNEARKFVKWAAANHPEAVDMNDITESIARQYGDWMASVFLASTHKGGRLILSHVWNVMAKRYRIKANPWRAVEAVKGDCSVRRDLTREELAKIAETLPGEYRTAFFVGCFTGLRLSDVANLTWECINLDAGEIALRPIKTARTSGRWVHIPIVPEFRAVLSAVPAARRHGLVMPEMARKYAVARTNLSADFVNMFTKAGIVTRTGGKGKPPHADGGKPARTNGGKGKPARNVVGFHSLRHTFVSIAANAGIPFALVQSIVGHSAAKMSEHYFHENRDATALAFRKFPALFGNAPQALPDNGKGEAIEAEVISETPTARQSAAAVLDGMTRAELVELRAEIEKRLAASPCA